METIIIYHKDCADGFCAAYAAWKTFGDTAKYIASYYGDTPPDVTGRRVYIVDFSYKRNQLLFLKERAKSLIVIDHHKTAEQELAGLEDFCIFNMNKSGAVLTWEYFHKSEPIPDLLLYIQDRDLWLWKLPMSKEVSSAISSYDMDFRVWDSLDVNKLREEGVAIERYRKAIVKRLVNNNSFSINLGGHIVKAVNTPILQSEIGEALCELGDFGVTYFDVGNRRKFSLRSRNDTDVSEIARSNGGGGHKGAAGFYRDIENV